MNYVDNVGLQIMLLSSLLSLGCVTIRQISYQDDVQPIFVINV